MLKDSYDSNFCQLSRKLGRYAEVGSVKRHPEDYDGDHSRSHDRQRKCRCFTDDGSHLKVIAFMIEPDDHPPQPLRGWGLDFYSSFWLNISTTDRL